MPADIAPKPSSSISSPSNAARLLGAARVNPFETYPIPLGLKDQELVHHIWASQHVNFQPFREYWFTLGMVDSAAMHLVLSNAALHLNHLRGNQSEDLTVLAHNAAALQSVNLRMADSNQNITDGLIGAVLGIICHDHLVSKFDSYPAHMAGLRQILLLRGGLHLIEANKTIRLSLFWIEHNLASDQDIVPLYPPPLHLLKNPYSATKKQHGAGHQNKVLAFSGLESLISSGMLEILNDLSVLIETLKFESSQRNIWQDPDFVGFNVYPTLYKLLAIQSRPREDEFRNLVQELFRLGSILFLAQIRRRFGVSPVVTTVQSAKLRMIFETNSMIWDKRLDCLRTWALIMAGCVASTQEERGWVARLLRSWLYMTCSQWGDITAIVSSMWWIDEVFSSGYKSLQDEYEKAHGKQVDIDEGMSREVPWNRNEETI